MKNMYFYKKYSIMNNNSFFFENSTESCSLQLTSSICSYNYKRERERERSNQAVTKTRGINSLTLPYSSTNFHPFFSDFTLTLYYIASENYFVFPSIGIFQEKQYTFIFSGENPLSKHYYKENHIIYL